VPFEIAFGLEFSVVFHFIVLSLFALDFLVQFRVTVLDDKTGEEI